MDSVEPGRACGSDTAHLGIFGYDPRQTYRGRGAFESMGAGCSVEPGDIAFKCNFATIDEASGLVTHRRVDRTFDIEGPELCGALDGVLLVRLCTGFLSLSFVYRSAPPINALSHTFMLSG